VGNHSISYTLLSDAGRSAYPDVNHWRDRRDEVPGVTGFHVLGNGADSGTVDVMVNHIPGLDSFTGLSPAMDKEVWTGERQHGGWLLDPNYTSQPVLPPDSGAPATTASWVRYVESCDPAGALRDQAVADLLGTKDAGSQFCAEKIPFTFGAPRDLPPGRATSELVAEYSSDAVIWARSVTLTGAAGPIDVVLAPIGQVWKVVGVFAGD
jgi:hypothetical protein